jgi:hypothetical protein
MAGRIATLDGHRAALANAIRGVHRGERLAIVSPCIGRRAVMLTG